TTGGSRAAEPGCIRRAAAAYCRSFGRHGSPWLGQVLRQAADGACSQARLAIEVDGWAWHSDVDRFATDRRRQNALVLAGWTVLRFTWNDLTCRPEAVIAQIRATLPAHGAEEEEAARRDGHPGAGAAASRVGGLAVRG
ncbi:MAG: endonuclease domain-containing protein, partial [Pseudonocardiaceae bacterium]